MTSKKTILVVDDEKINRLLLRHILGKKYNIIEAENGKEALEVLHQHHNDVRLVLLDIVMPIMDGYDVLKAVRKNNILSQTPIIITSAETDEESEVKALSYGANDYITKPYNPEIVIHRISSILGLVETCAVLSAVQRDPLTGVYSKGYFYMCVSETLKNNPDKEYDLVCSDIEHFKLINDMYGSASGDRILRYVAEMNTGYIAELGFTGRIGPDIFACLVERKIEYSNELFAKGIKFVNDFSSDSDVNMNIIIRYGIYHISNRSTPVNIMCDRACLAKESIKGRYDTYFAYYDDEIRQKLLSEKLIASEMKSALDEGQFHVYFQPKINLHTEKMAGAEALVRWIHPTMGFMSPGEFIPLFEKNGFITSLDIYIWEQCFKAVRKWIDDGHKPVPISVNVSRLDIYNPHLFDILSSFTKKYSLDPKYIHLEITESAYTETPEQLIGVVKRLKDFGFPIEMDDFGTGYSSLNMISEFPIDILKLDMRFIQSEEKHSNNKSILSFIVSLAKWLNLKIIAEGVETATQVRLLQSLSCDYAQGFYFAKPLPQPEFENMLFALSENPDDLETLDNSWESEENLKVMLILDSKKNDAPMLEKTFKSLYKTLSVNNIKDALDTVNQLKQNIGIAIVVATDTKICDFSEFMNACNVFDIPAFCITNLLKSADEALGIGFSDVATIPYSETTIKNRIQNVIISAEAFRIKNKDAVISTLSEMKRRAEEDSLTGLLNRSEFESRINTFFNQYPDSDSVLILADIDYFKEINDRFGRSTGDSVISDFAEKLSELFPETNIISRTSGDVFGVFIPQKISDIMLEEKLLKLVSDLTLNVNEKTLTCSFGVCSSPLSGSDYETLYENAEAALLDAKEHGGGHFSIYSPEMEHNIKSENLNILSLLDGTSDATFVADAVTSEILYINDTACRLVGRDKASCLKLRCYQLFWNSCTNCERCVYIDKCTNTSYEEDAILPGGKTKIHIKARLDEWNGRKVKIHYLQNITAL